MKAIKSNASLVFQPYRAPSSSFSSSFSSSSSDVSSAVHQTSNVMARALNAASDTPLPSSNIKGESATDRGQWDVCYLYLHGLDFTDNLNLFPKTISIIR